MEKHGDVYKAYENYGKLAHTVGGSLPEKVRWLIKVAVSAAGQHHYALWTHVKALKSGCSREEIEHALLLVTPTAGFPTAMEGILILRQEMGEQTSPAD